MAEPSKWFAGCPACAGEMPLEVVYDLSDAPRLDLAAASAWARQELRPLTVPTAIDLGRVTTPLMFAPRLGSNVHIKNEAFNPTCSHKDRYHAFAVGAASRLGARGIVTSSTGNHGVAAAAHAAAARLPAVILCHPDAPAGLLRTIAAFGGLAAQLPVDDQRFVLGELVSQGWFPATSMDPAMSGAANPFGAESYRSIAYEIVEQLTRMPDVIVVPTAGGDTVYGIAKGFSEISHLTSLRPPHVIAVQPEGANPLSRSIAAGTSVAVEHPRSIALSLSDRATGRQAMVALTRSGGRALDVAEPEIGAAVRDLSAIGIYAEPASAAALAGYRSAISRELIDDDALTVLLITSTGFKWPESMAQIIDAQPATSLPAVRQWIADRRQSSNTEA
jgi:threonine synthase